MWKTLRAAILSLKTEISTPSGADESGYKAAVIGGGHALIGAILQATLAGIAPFLAPLRFAISLGYWLIKERGDLNRKGGLIDGIRDTAFVLIGTAYTGDILWVVAVWAAMVLEAIARQFRIERKKEQNENH